MNNSTNNLTEMLSTLDEWKPFLGLLLTAGTVFLALCACYDCIVKKCASRKVGSSGVEQIETGQGEVEREVKDVRGRAMEQIEGAADRDVPVIDPIDVTGQSRGVVIGMEEGEAEMEWEGQTEAEWEMEMEAEWESADNAEADSVFEDAIEFVDEM